MGAGKSAVGRQLARLLHLDFIDSDEEIESRTGALAPLAADWHLVEGSVRHTFTHFHLELMVMTGWVAEAEAAPPDGARWHPLGRLDALALPTLMKKVIRHARGASLEGISGASIG